jgi:transglutaminase-like putative cysteine protease
MKVRVGCELAFEADVMVPLLMLVAVRPDRNSRAERESTRAEPDLPVHEYVDAFGNRCWRFTLPVGAFSIRYEALVDVDLAEDVVVPDARLVPPQELPDSTLAFTLPSRQVESDLLLADAWRLFGATPPTWARVQAICDWVHQNVEYDAGVSGPTQLGTAVGVYQRRRGVCRDFALLAVAFCRALNIPARYTFGYLPDIGVPPPETPMDFHAWFEAFVDGRWYAFDARHNTPRIGRVTVGRGRDAVDAALTTTYGEARLLRMDVWAEEAGTGIPETELRRPT